MSTQRTKILTIIGIIILMLAIIYVLLRVASSELRKDGEAFLLELSAGEMTAARARLSDDFAAEWTEESLEEKFGAMEPFTSVSLPLIGIKGITSTMNVTGTAETASGCASVVYLSFDVTWRFDNLGIENFDIDTNCTEN